MAYKILTKNGIDNSNIDGARGEYFNSGMRDGIVQGALNEGAFIASSSNVISLDTCELRIAGHRIVIDEPVYHTFTNAPSTDTRYAFVAQIIVDDNQNVDFSLFVQTANTPLIQNDLYKTITGAGTYQVEIGRFTLTTGLVIEDVVRTIDVITGGTGKGSGSTINIGNVTTQTLDPDVDAEVDVSERYEEDEGKEYLDFTFGIPKAEVNVDTELSTTSENAVQNKVITNALNEKLGNNGEQILNGALEVTAETFDEPSVTVDKSVTVNNSGNNTSKTTTNIAQINTNGLAIGQVEETTTSSGSDTVAKEVLYGLSDIKVNGSSIIRFTDGDVTVNGNLTSLSTEATPVNYMAVSKKYTLEGPSSTRDMNMNSKIYPSIIDLSNESTTTNSSETITTTNAVRIDPSSMRISGKPFSFSIKSSADDSYSPAASISTNGVFNFFKTPIVNSSPVFVATTPNWVAGTSGSLTLPGAGWYILYGNYSYTGIVWWSPQDPNGEQVTTGYVALNNNIAISTSGVVSLLNAPSGVTVYYYKIG